jgi:hypothetical protein
MLNRIHKLCFIAACGALLSAGPHASNASNVYDSTTPAAEETSTTTPAPAYWSTPAEAMNQTARADHLVPRTDVPLVDAPQGSGRTPEDESRYFDYSRMILGD